ncbi:mechanosensitive ion channel family protein [Rhodococcus sp. HM1]|uniref:mechanosensitive ion channel family protein n=1 Tax=Rhodococcus sp. HM1 TaxID=2937759 RepID=UPI00200B9CA4|nr:mechanosensitive ion channel family protein [Rhodococcus sp. HM1]MCK8670005.1 mechanosensitive ion channel family protein [Rhodococcus sp. HM1]
MSPSPAPVVGIDQLVRWLSLHGLSIVLWVTGALITARFVQWSIGRVTRRIDDAFEESDALVRTESAKHRHSVAQVIAWILYSIIYIVAAVGVLRNLGLPVAGIVAPATIIGAALGFGAQRIVQDLLAGFFIITEKQYGFGDLVSLGVSGSSVPADGTVEDVTLRITQLRSTDGELVTVPNGQIIKAVNLSRDWARAVVDIPVPVGVDMTRVNSFLDRVGHEAYHDPSIGPLLLDEPTVHGLTSIGIETMTVRMGARTLPGKQFEVDRDLRLRITHAFGEADITLSPSTITHPAAPEVPAEQRTGA